MGAKISDWAPNVPNPFDIFVTHSNGWLQSIPLAELRFMLGWSSAHCACMRFNGLSFDAATSFNPQGSSALAVRAGFDSASKIHCAG